MAFDAFASGTAQHERTAWFYGGEESVAFIEAGFEGCESFLEGIEEPCEFTSLGISVWF